MQKKWIVWLSLALFLLPGVIMAAQSGDQAGEMEMVDLVKKDKKKAPKTLSRKQWEKRKKKAQKKCLSLFISVKKEGQSILSKNFYFYMGLPADSPDTSKALQRHIHLISTVSAHKIPHRNLVISTEIQKPFRGLSPKTDTHIAFSIRFPFQQAPAPFTEK